MLSVHIGSRLPMARARSRWRIGKGVRYTPFLVVGILLVLSLSPAIRADSGGLPSPVPASDSVRPDHAPAVLEPSMLAAGPSTWSGWEIWSSGLPPNVTASFVFGQFGPQGYWYASGLMEDGSGGAGGPLGPGVYELYVQPAPGFIPVPASATYFVSTPGLLNVTVSFIPATPCYQVFTELGLPQGTEWWVVGASGVAFFANNSVIDATGCGSVNRVVIGSSIGYPVESYSPSAFFPAGAAVPVIFVTPSGASTAQLPGVSVALVGVLTGFAVAVMYDVVRRRRGRT